MKKLSIILGVLFLATQTFAQKPDYDQLSIAPQTWEEVDLTYINTIDGKKYTEHANLLRPRAWILHNHLDSKGAYVHLAKEQLGTAADIDVTVTGIKPATLDYSYDSKENIKPVIATFLTHSKDVWEYTFADQYGHREKIRAVANHPFYVPRLKRYVAIGEIPIRAENRELLKGSNGNTIALINKTPLNQVEPVYNFEVYQQHDYKVGKSHILVHNVSCAEPDARDKEYASQLWGNPDYEREAGWGTACVLNSGCLIAHYGFEKSPTAFIPALKKSISLMERFNKWRYGLPGFRYSNLKKALNKLGIKAQIPDKLMYSQFKGKLLTLETFQQLLNPVIEENNSYKALFLSIHPEDSPIGHAMSFVKLENKLYISDSAAEAGPLLLDEDNKMEIVADYYNNGAENAVSSGNIIVFRFDTNATIIDFHYY